MQTRRLGQTQWQCPAIGLGGMPLSIQDRPDESKAMAVIEKALALGVKLIDTADVYCLDDSEIGHNERLIQQVIAKENLAEDLLVATKGGLERPEGQWVVNGSPEHLVKACDKSLQALQVERIELYQLHAPDPSVPFLESVGQLRELQDQGKIHHIGLSNVEVHHIEKAQTITEIVSVQNRCNVHDLRAFHQGVIPYCQAHKIAFLAYSPVGGRHGKEFVEKDIYLNDMANQYQVTPYQIALAWLLAQSEVIFAIPGASRQKSIEDSWATLALNLAPEDIQQLNQTYGLDTI